MKPSENPNERFTMHDEDAASCTITVPAGTSAERIKELEKATGSKVVVADDKNNKEKK